MKKLNSIVSIFVLLTLLVASFAQITSASAPTVVTNNATGVTSVNATLHGTLSDAGVPTLVCRLTESYTTQNTQQDTQGGTPGHEHWLAQTFTVSATENVHNISLLLYRSAAHSPGLITVGIRATDGSGYPTGNDLTNGTTNGNTLPTGSPYEWRNVTVNTTLLTSGIVYAIVARSAGECHWRTNHPGTYTGGAMYASSNSGGSWGSIPHDGDFKLWSYNTSICYVHFQYGYTTSYGNNTPSEMKNTGDTFKYNASSLTPGRQYHFIANATNGVFVTGSDTKFLTKPIPSKVLNATRNSSGFTLNWTKGTGANYTRIQGKIGSFPTSISDGTNIYNGTGIRVNHFSLTTGDKWYYSMWSFTVWGTLSQWSSVYSGVYKLVVANPTVSTNASTNVSTTTATLNGFLNNNGSIDVVFMSCRYGYTTAYGNVSTLQPRTTGQHYLSNIASLTQGRLYHFQARATNSNGTGYGSDLTFLTKPSALTNFSAKRETNTRINLSWTKGIGSNNTYVERNTIGSSWPIGSGTLIYNNTGTYYPNTGLSKGVTYYYEAWSYSHWGTLHQWSTSGVASNNITNQKPQITSVSPANSSTHVSVIIGYLSFTINDREGDKINYTVTTSPNIGSATAVNQGNGTYNVAITTLAYSTTYTWTISLHNGTTWTNETLHFTTKSSGGNPPNQPSAPSPSNAELGVDIGIGVLSCSVSDPDNDPMNVSFYWGNSTLISYNYLVSSGSKTSINIGTLLFNTTYYWYVIVNDSNYQTQSAIWSFKTTTNTTEITVTPATYDFSNMSFSEIKISTDVTITNIGVNITKVQASFSSMNDSTGVYTWSFYSIPSVNMFTLKFYDESSLTWTTLNDTYQDVIGTIGSGNSSDFKLEFFAPVSSSYVGEMCGVLKLRYTGSINRTLDFPITVTITTGVPTSIRLTETIRGGILGCDAFYLPVKSNLTTNTTISLPASYSKTFLFFFTQSKDISSMIVYGVTSDWKFKVIETTGTVSSFKLTVSDFNNYDGFVVVPNPGYFQKSSWWFNILNSARDMYTKGELLS